MIHVFYKWNIPYHTRNANPYLMDLDDAVCEYVDALPYGDVLAHRVEDGMDILFAREDDAIAFKLKFGV